MPEYLKRIVPYGIILLAAVGFAFLANRSRGGEEVGADVFILQVCIYYVQFMVFYWIGRFIRGVVKGRRNKPRVNTDEH